MDLRTLRYFVAVAEERHIGRAAARLRMTQPPLSRAIKQLEIELGTVLLHRSSSGVAPTAAGTVLYEEARTLLEHAEQVPAKVAAATGTSTIRIGVLANSAEQAGNRLAAAFRRRHPDVLVIVREADFADPTAGLRAGLVDVALTRTPFDDTGISTRVLRVDPVGVVLRTDDPLAGREVLQIRDLAGRRWFRLPDGLDPVWCAYWVGTGPAGDRRDGPVVRTVHECMQAVLWNGSIGLAPLPEPLPDGLTCVPLADWPPTHLIVAWNTTSTSPLIHSFARIAAATHHTMATRPAAQGSGR